MFHDTVFVSGGEASITTMMKQGDAIRVVQEAFRHCKTIGASGEGVQLLDAPSEATRPKMMSHKGLLTSPADLKAPVREYIEAMKQHRHFDRADKQVPA